MTTAVGTETEPPAQAGYPVRLDIARPEKQSRLTNFPGIGSFIREILIIPNFIVYYVVSLIGVVLYFIATFAILFTGRYPQGLYNFVAGYLRWSANIYGYTLSLYDRYPPFSTEQKPDYPLTFAVDYPERSSRLLNFPLFGLYIRELLLIPHLVVVLFLWLVAFVVLIIAQFAILFTGSYPEGMHKFSTGVMRWSIRLNAYIFGLTDKYPPFSLS